MIYIPFPLNPICLYHALPPRYAEGSREDSLRKDRMKILMAKWGRAVPASLARVSPVRPPASTFNRQLFEDYVEQIARAPAVVIEKDR
jgi:hypothetical protein